MQINPNICHNVNILPDATPQVEAWYERFTELYFCPGWSNTAATCQTESVLRVLRAMKNEILINKSIKILVSM